MSFFAPVHSTVNPPKAEAAPLPKEAISAVSENETQALQKFTVQTAEADGINPVIPVYVITHESQWFSHAKGDHGLANGIAQFHYSTFEWMKKQANMPNLQYNNPKDQITLMEWAISKNEGNNWTTYRKFESLQ